MFFLCSLLHKKLKACCSTAWPPSSLHLRSSPVHHRELIFGSKPRPQIRPQVNSFSSQNRISKIFPFLSKILEKLQLLQQNRHSATDQLKFLTTSRQWTAHETEPNSQEVFSEKQVSWCLIKRPYLRKEASLKMRVKMRVSR